MSTRLLVTPEAMSFRRTIATERDALTRTQRDALDYLRGDAVGHVWPAQRGRMSAGNVTPWSRDTLDALVSLGLAEWRSRVGVMPHIIPTLWRPDRIRYMPAADRANGRDADKGPGRWCTATHARFDPAALPWSCSRQVRHIGPHLAGASNNLTVMAGWGQ